MMTNSVLQMTIYMVVLIGAAVPLGAFMAAVLEGRRTIFSPLFDPVERAIYRAAGVRADDGMNWRRYAIAVLTFSVVGVIATYVLLRMQGTLPLNPQHMPGVPSHTALNIAVSFITNTNWQNYGGESTLSYFSQMIALAVHNFTSAATGIAVMAALSRGIAGRETNDLGNFWVDLTRSTLHILLPASLIFALFLISQGVVQTFSPYVVAHTLEGREQTIALGPAASQSAIKQLGTNGGGFFNANSAHPFENPTALSNFVEMLALLLIPAALCFTYGRMVRDKRQGWMLIGAMTLIFVGFLAFCYHFESRENPALANLGLSSTPFMEGKETRFGIANSVIWATATTAASNGSVNAMHDSFSPLGGMVPLVMMHLGEIVYGGVGSGIYGMLIFVIISVFMAGLMVGRTPEYLGKKIGPYEMKAASIILLLPPLAMLTASAIGVSVPSMLDSRSNPGAHGLTEIIYAFTSQANNNGSSFGGLSVNESAYNYIGALCMWMGRFFVIVPVLAIAGSLAAKKYTPPSPGTLPTHTPLFMAVLVAVILTVAALTIFPVLALGPIAEHLSLSSVAVK
ncbi:potassium-transporting ATPase subunit KdpA [soil metagenome]